MERKNNKYIYIGCFFIKDDVLNRISVINRHQLEVTPNYLHVTFQYKPELVDEDLFGEVIHVRVLGYGYNDDNEGLLVELKSDNKKVQEYIDVIEVPHITLSRSESGKAVNTRFLDFKPLDNDEVIEFTGTFGGYGYDNGVWTTRKNVSKAEYGFDYVMYHSENPETRLVSNVMDLINNKVKHICVTTLVGMGITRTLPVVFKKINDTFNESILWISDVGVINEQNKKIVSESNMTSFVNVVSFKEFLEGDYSAYKYIVFHHLRNDIRTKVIPFINEDVTTISIMDLLTAKRNSEFPINISFDQLSEIKFLVFNMFGLYDLRDILVAPPDEASKIRAYLMERIESLEREIAVIEQHIASPKKTYKTYFDKIYTMKIEDENRNYREEIAKLKADNIKKDKIIEKKDEELKMAHRAIVEKNEVISIYEACANNVGINREDIDKAAAVIIRLRNELDDDLNSEDENVRELAMKALQDETAELLSEILRKSNIFTDKESFEKKLISDLTEKIWEQLDSKSRNFLITAIIEYKHMSDLPDKDTLDFAGVCLMITKALEVEVCKRFCTAYKRFLDEKFDSVSEWPEAMRRKVDEIVTNRRLPENHFTLGSVIHVTGFNNSSPDPLFVEYALEVLFEGMDEQEVINELRSDVEFIERVRLDYRNPTAHQGEVNLITATQCFDYVITIERMLKKMLIKMKF